MLHKLHKHTISFRNAYNGVVWCLKTQPNYQIHLSFSILALVAGLYFHITYIEYIVIILLITIGLVIETINTALEQTTDAIDQKWREDIKIAKDVAAAAMLIFAVGAFFISCIIFIPRFISIASVSIK